MRRPPTRKGWERIQGFKPMRVQSMELRSFPERTRAWFCFRGGFRKKITI